LREVGGEEYRADVLVELVPEGNRLFSKSGYWKEYGLFSKTMHLHTVQGKPKKNLSG
jgi:hypothetical protein